MVLLLLFFSAVILVTLLVVAQRLPHRLGAKSWEEADAAREEASQDAAPSPATETSAEFKRFQRSYLLVFCCVYFADWLQGPYVYALYESHGFGKADIGRLFVCGYGSSMIFGTFAGGLADKFGRKRMAVSFGVLYSCACLLYRVRNFWVLFCGRLLAGISTSLLWTVFEAWMVYEHHDRGFRPEWLSSTFSISSFLNGLLAICAGLLSTLVANEWGPTAPFMASFAFLVVGTVLVLVTWGENTGDSNASVLSTFKNAFSVLNEDRRVLMLGVSQSLFEASMYTFVFLWTPSLQGKDSGSDNRRPELGLIFATFMVCTMIGSTVFRILSTLELSAAFISRIVLLLAAGALSVVPVIFPYKLLVLLAFLAFEIACGLFWPTWGTLRSILIPEPSRAAVSNIFRIPLNFLVVAVLLNVSRIPEDSIFWLTSLWLSVALVVQLILVRRLLSTAEQSSSGREVS